MSAHPAKLPSRAAVVQAAVGKRFRGLLMACLLGHVNCSKHAYGISMDNRRYWPGILPMPVADCPGRQQIVDWRTTGGAERHGAASQSGRRSSGGPKSRKADRAFARPALRLSGWERVSGWGQLTARPQDSW